MREENKTRKELSQYLTFILDGEEYGVPILNVNGIKGLEKSTPIPNSPDYVMGIINLRGEVVPIVDLRKRFALSPAQFSSHTVIIVVRVGNAEHKRTIGLVVDAVADVYDISADMIHSTPDFGNKLEQGFVKGLGMIGEKLVILLDINNLIDWNNITDDARTPQAVLAMADATLAA